MLKVHTINFNTVRIRSNTVEYVDTVTVKSLTTVHGHSFGVTLTMWTSCQHNVAYAVTVRAYTVRSHSCPQSH